MVTATHDWVNRASTSSGPTDDRWSDVKTPGDGRIYSVGTARPDSSDPFTNPLFSDSSVFADGTSLYVTSSRQVAVLQVVDSANQSILWQRYFHGATLGQTGGGLSTHGRSVSVFPASDPMETRIAICGATFDQVLPKVEPAGTSNTNFGNTYSGGFLAIYNGAGDLLWSYHFFGDDPSGSTAVTDVSIRVEGGVDVVTYCGASANGVRAPSPGNSSISTMAPYLPFDPPVNGIDATAGGDTHHASANNLPTNQWDGFVGRLTADHANPAGTVQVAFHSIVGGYTNDSLFGIAEIDADKFFVVGSVSAAAPGSGSTLTAPITHQVPFNWPTPPNPAFSFLSSSFNSFGTVFWFDATNTRATPRGKLDLLFSTLIGSSEDYRTVARDVIHHGGRVWIVGSTDDPTFSSLDPNPAVPPLPAPAGTAAGFLLGAANLFAGFDLASHVYGLVDIANETHLTGISAWNEFPDHVAIAGWTETTDEGLDILAESWFYDAATSRLRRIRTTQFGGSGHDLTCHEAALANGLANPALVAFWELQGGGVAMDPRGRVSVVGCTFSSYPNTIVDFPGSGTLYPAVLRAPQQGHKLTSADADSVRTDFDMLPSGTTFGACRTDGTGPYLGWSPSSSYAGDGGTTPACALAPFGNLIGSTPSLVQRTLIDLEGNLYGGSTNAAVLVDRPAPTSTLQGSVMQIGFPSTLPVVALGIETWINGPSAVGVLYFTSNTSLRIPLGTLPSGSQTFSIQFVSLVTLPPGATLCGNPTFTYAATPALILSY
jgi:hypothetical protein